MNKFTQGPWWVEPLEFDDKYDSSNKIIYQILTNKGRYPATICIVEEHYEVAEPINRKADAHLIAAAPDLFKALIGVLQVADRETIEFKMAHAAIAKAKGEE